MTNLQSIPNSEQIESAVLGSMLIEQPIIPLGLSELNQDCFYNPKHQIIFNVIAAMYRDNHSIDMVTVMHHLKQKDDLKKAGGPDYLAQLANRVNSGANFEYHCTILKEQMFRRLLIKQSGELHHKAYEGSNDVFDLLDLGYSELNKIAEFIQRRKNLSMRELVKKNLETIEKRRQQPGGVIGISTGYREVDKITGGYHPTDLVVIAARPGMGKTSYMMQSARYAAIEKQIPVAVFSIEMSADQLVLRLQSAEAEINSNDLRNGRISREEFEHVYRVSEALLTEKLIIDDTPGLKLYELKAKCSLYKNKHDIQAVFIDYLTLIQSATNGNMHVKVSEITKTLKSIAKELKVPVIVLSQLSRAVEQRDDKRPQLSDLRESGSIEEDADQVIFLFRPDYYDNSDERLKGICQVKIAKNRHGNTASVPLKFLAPYTKFVDIEPDYDAKF